MFRWSRGHCHVNRVYSEIAITRLCVRNTHVVVGNLEAQTSSVGRLPLTGVGKPPMEETAGEGARGVRQALWRLVAADETVEATLRGPLGVLVAVGLVPAPVLVSLGKARDGDAVLISSWFGEVS